MMLRTTFVGALAIVALAACGDDTGGAGGNGDGGSGSTTTTTGTDASGNTTTGGDGGSGAGTGDGGSGAGTGDGGGGEGGGETAYDCASYCGDVTEACTGENTQYPNEESCLAACEAFDAGAFQDTGNTLGCRAYHATAALDQPDVHCPHAGPLGTGACSADAASPCEAFCAIAEVICPDAYQGDCTKSCAVYAAGDYNAGQDTAPEDDSLACRMYHLTVAAVSEDSAGIHCDHVTAQPGGGQCGG